MIKQLYIDNFKSLIDFNLPCNSPTCLIGVNNSGKSSVLQIIDLLSSVSKGDIKNWFNSREWHPKDVKSKLKKDRQHTISFNIEFSMEDTDYSWGGTFNLNSYTCSSETILKHNENNDSSLLKVENNTYSILEKTKKTVDFAYEGSILAFLREQLLNDELVKIKQFLNSVNSLELLNPLLLRKRARTAEENLGVGGEKLSAFLYNLSPDKKKFIYTQMSHLFNAFASYHVRTERSGWKELWILEKFLNNYRITTEAKHISDGFLRILALFSQIQTNNSILLFDEIEDGLNHEVMEFLMDELVKAPQQIFFTTHSPMILNFLEDETAKESVMFVYRDKQTGKTKACKFFDLPGINEKLEYMGPGEVFANVNLNELSDSI